MHLSVLLRVRERLPPAASGGGGGVREAAAEVRLVDLAGWVRPEPRPARPPGGGGAAGAAAGAAGAAGEDMVVKAFMRVVDGLASRAGHVAYR